MATLDYNGPGRQLGMNPDNCQWPSTYKQLRQLKTRLIEVEIFFLIFLSAHAQSCQVPADL